METDEFALRINQIKTRLYRIAVLMLGSSSMAMDAVDEAVFRGLRYIKQLKQEEYFNTWMTRILINVCNQELRHQKHELPVDELPETSSESYDTLPLKIAIQKLPQDLKKIIILRYFSSYTLSETAAILNIPQGTVVTRQRKALQLLRLNLLEEGGNENEPIR